MLFKAKPKHPTDTVIAASARMRAWIALFILVGILVVAVLGIGSSIFYRFQQTVPDYSGTEKLSGLNSEVRIYRDDYGVPHIFASNRADALRALGFVHASERMFQMELNRRAGQGRLSELFGPTTLKADKLIRTLNLYGLAKDSVKVMSPAARNLYQAYAEGVNAWINENKNMLPPEFLVVGAKIEPWKVEDSVVWGKLLALQHSKNMQLELARAKLSGKLTPDQFDLLFPSMPGDTPITIAPRFSRKTAQSDESDPIEQIGKIIGVLGAASNEWAISGKLTVTGKPILANDPHLNLEAPILWYLARMVTPEGELKGVTVPGVPAVLLGQNQNIAWGFTTTRSDAQDLFIETIDPKDDDFYLTPSGKQRFEKRTEKIYVKGRGDVTIDVRATRHGPVISDINEDAEDIAGDGKVMALAFSGLGSDDTTAQAMLDLNVAKDWDGVLAAMKLYHTPAQNLIYADAKGNIGFYNPGRIPVRKKGNGTMPVDGASGDYDWRGFIPYNALPQAYNPPAGFLFNANNSVAGLGFPRWLGGDWEEDWRAKRIQQLFDIISKHSIETSAAMQADHVSGVAKAFLPYLIALKTDGEKVKHAQEMLRAWDGNMDKTRPEPLIFEAWLYFVQQRLFDDFGDLSDQGPFKAKVVLAAISETKNIWCKDKATLEKQPCNELMLDAFEDALDWIANRQGPDMSKWQWGREHKAVFAHKIFSHLPFFNNYSDSSVASSGDFYTLDRGGSFKVEKPDIFARRHGGGYRGIYDLSNPANSRFMIALGQSGNVMSPHYRDLLEMWNDVKYITLTGTQEELAQNGSREIRLVP